MGLDVGEIGLGVDLSLDLKVFAARSVGRAARDGVPPAAVDDCIRLLEEERGKIEMFRRELPLCARLLAGVIDVMKEEADKNKSDHKSDRVEEEEEDGGAGDKSNWMSTAQLWTGNSGPDDADFKKEDKKSHCIETNSHGGNGFPFKTVGSGAPAFTPPCFRKEDKVCDMEMSGLSLLSPAPVKSTPASATGVADQSHRQVVGFAQAAARAAAAMAPSGANLSLQAQQQQQQARKARRCWSPELHRQFVSALQQLGGPQVATPKQIRELMKVDGLTNDEVKSHLQKYRLHNRRAPSSTVVSQPILIVNPAGLWISPEQSSSQSGSPQGPLHFTTSGIAVSSAATVSCEEEDGRSESYGWK